MKAISLKLEDRQFRLLEQVSKSTQIPKSALMRKGIELVLLQAKEDVISRAFRREVDLVLSEDKLPLKRLAQS